MRTALSLFAAFATALVACSSGQDSPDPSGTTTTDEPCKIFGDAKNQYAVKVAADAGGGVILAINHAGTVDLGGGAAPNAGGEDITVGKLAAQGNHLWTRHYGSSAGDQFKDIAVDSQSNVILVGAATSAIDLGGGALPAGGGVDILVWKLDPQGNHLWSKRFATSKDEYVWAVAVDANDDVLLFGNALDLGALDFGMGPSGAQGTMFLAKLANDGDLGGGAIAGQGSNDCPFLGKLDAQGNHLWSRAFKSAPGLGVSGVAVAPNGDVLITGIHEDGLDLGNGILGDGSNDAPAMFVGRYDAAGNHLYSQSLGGGEDPNYAAGVAAVFDAAGDPTIVGAARGYVDLGAGYVGSDDYQILLSTFDPAGGLLFSTRYGKTLPAVAHSVARSPDGYLLVAGLADGTIDFGTGLLTSAGGHDVVVAKLAPP